MYWFKWFIMKKIRRVEVWEVKVMCEWNKDCEDYGDNLCELAKRIKGMMNENSEVVGKVEDNKVSKHDAWWWNACKNVSDLLAELATVYYLKQEENDSATE